MWWTMKPLVIISNVIVSVWVPLGPWLVAHGGSLQPQTLNYRIIPRFYYGGTKVLNTKVRKVESAWGSPASELNNKLNNRNWLFSTLLMKHMSSWVTEVALSTQRAPQMAMRGLEWGKIESTSCLQLKNFWITRSGPQISPNQTIHGALRVCILVTYILPCTRDFVQFSFFPCTCLVMRWEASKSFGNQVQDCSNATACSKLWKILR